MRLLKKVCFRALLCLLTVAVAALIGGHMALRAITHGVSQAAADDFALRALADDRTAFLAMLYYTPAELAAIRARNVVVSAQTLAPVAGEKKEKAPEAALPEMELLDVSGDWYRGKLLIVRDRARLRCVKTEGDTPMGAARANAALAALGFGAEDSAAAGFSADMRLAFAAEEIDIAVPCEWILAQGGVYADVTHLVDAPAPRAAIAQTAEGWTLMLAIDGRTVESLGATVAEVARIFMDYGATDALLLNGGLTPRLYYDGAYRNRGSAQTPQNDAEWVVLALEGEDAQTSA